MGGFSNSRFVLKPDVAIASEVLILSKNSLAIADFHAKKTQHVQLFENPLPGTPPFVIPKIKFLIQNGQESAEKCSEPFPLSLLPLYPSPICGRHTHQQLIKQPTQKKSRQQCEARRLYPFSLRADGSPCQGNTCSKQNVGKSPRPSKSGTTKEPKPKRLGPDIFRWSGGLRREGVGAKKFGMPLETREIKPFWRDIPGFRRDIPGVPEKFKKKKVCVQFSSPTK